MKRFFLTFSLLSCLLFPTLAFAQDYRSDVVKQTEAFAGTEGANYGSPRDPRLIVAYTIQILLTAIGMLFLGYTVYAGYVIMMARGDDAEITKGRETLKTAVMGVVIVLSAYSITLFVAGVALSSSGRCYRTSLLDILRFRNTFHEISCAELDTSNRPDGDKQYEDELRFQFDAPGVGTVPVDIGKEENFDEFIKRDPLK